MASSSAEALELLALVLERGRGLIVLVSADISEGHALIETLGARFGVRAVTWEHAFDPPRVDDHRARVVWDLPFLDASLRHDALVRLNRSRDRLAGLTATTLLWVLDEDLPACWRDAQDLMDWAVEVVHWPVQPRHLPQLPALVQLPPSATLAAPLSAATLPYRWSTFTALSSPGARTWLELGGVHLVHAALGLGLFLVEQGERVALCDLRRADVARTSRWLRAFDWRDIVLLVGSFPRRVELPEWARVAVLVEERAHPPTPWRRLNVSIARLGLPQPHSLFSPIPTLVHDRFGVGDLLALESRLAASLEDEADER